MSNQSEAFEFVLLCFPGLQQKFQVLVSITMFILYISTLQMVLLYSTIISQRVTTTLCCVFWVLCAIPSAYATFMALNASFCGRNKIYNCFCYSNVVYKLTCSDVFSVQQNLLIISMLSLFIPLAFITLSYIIIIKTVCTSTSSDNWCKAFYTCTTHLMVIALYFIPRVIIYTSNWVKLTLNIDVRTLVLCLYSYTPHVVNPVIYCLRTKESK
ncbi:hypothetical protein XELAEV_18027644mg [Xenopus laevis]|uniref:G-protein coupled receptors family 1 profile domain-containing protein n=1 Tax=Xenopus laevis TaxID=8355 RepID=A0A974CY29_XENLA|nr:hypothetical protein XELAEV_18027644mg [Xenopus laevis]